MTSRKKLSHLRAQIKRQASMAARSKLEKRSSVGGVEITNMEGDKSGHFGVSCDASSSIKYQTGDEHHHHHFKEPQNQPNSSSSAESPGAYHQSTSSAATGAGNNSDANPNTNMSPTLHNETGHGLGGSSNAKLVGQHSLAAPGHHRDSHHHSIHQKNFKQKIIALLKKFRTDGSDFDSEEQYREALERELIKAAAGRCSRAIEELLEEDIDVEEESGPEPEGWDNISESSTPKPSLRPFFLVDSNNTTTSSLPSQTASSSDANNQQLPPTITTTATKPHNQHPISQIPMTTRKKLSHLRAQIKRQASKAARSRLEKRSSVGGVEITNVEGDKSGHFGVSCDASSSIKHQTGDGHHHHFKEPQNQPNSCSSTESPGAYHQSTSSAAAVSGNNSADANPNTNVSPTLNNETGHGLGGSSNAKLVGQHSLAAPGHHRDSHHHSIHQKNFKQKIIALLKKFRTDGSDFDSEEQYREALERELIKAAAGRGSKAIEELLEEDIDVEEESGTEPDGWDNISETSTPKPSLRPFFSSTTLDKI